jgi:hypothetical protein
MNEIIEDQFVKSYYKNKLPHREDGPAKEYKNGDKEYYVNGYLHRDDGPAIDYVSRNYKAWYVHGKYVREENNTKDKHNKANLLVKEASGNIMIRGKLTSFLYELIRDYLPAGEVELIVRNCSESEVSYTNGWLAKYAENLAERLKDNKD